LFQTGSAAKQSQYVESAKGIREYFNAMLGTHLLYKFERIQYKEILEKDDQKPASEIYGYVQLVRLFVR